VSGGGSSGSPGDLRRRLQLAPRASAVSLRPLGLMDKASDFYSEDCGFESRRGCFRSGAPHTAGQLLDSVWRAIREMADSWRMAMTGVLHGYGLKGMGLSAELPAKAQPGLTTPHCWAAARERVGSHQRAGRKLLDSDDGRATWLLSGRYRAIRRSTSRGTARPCGPHTAGRIASPQRAGRKLVDSDDGGAAWLPSCKYKAIGRAAHRGTARPDGPHTAGQLLESE
jgi:hypothetical protein